MHGHFKNNSMASSMLSTADQVVITVFHVSLTELFPPFDVQKILRDIKASSLVKMRTLVLGGVGRKEEINHFLERKGSFSGAFNTSCPRSPYL